MREIKRIQIVAPRYGVKTYSIGDEVNGLEIKQIVDCSVEYENSLHIGYRCMGDNHSDYIAEIWNTPVIAEYYEKESECDKK